MKRFVSLLLLVIMVVSIFAGCNNLSTDNGQVGALQTTTDKNAIPDLTGRTITILTTDTWLAGMTLSDVLPKFKQIEERTGCTIVWETAPGGSDFDTVLQTRLTGDPSESPDIILLPTNTTVLSKYIDQDLLFDITRAYD